MFYRDLYSNDEFNILIGKNIEFMDSNASLFEKRIKKQDN